MFTWREHATTYDNPAPEEETRYEATYDGNILRAIYDTSVDRWHWQAFGRDGTLHADGHVDTLVAARDAAEKSLPI